MTLTTPASPNPGSGQMFNSIATRYDLLNKLMSFGQDKRWRRHLVRALDLGASPKVLDLATGTADVAIDIATAHRDAEVIGLDPSTEMLAVGESKLRAAGLSDRVSLVTGDAQDLPFDDNAFDATCISFGIRNVPDRAAALREMSRVTKPGGRVVVLELSEPRAGWTAPMARWHVHNVVPKLGALLSGSQEYAYLQQSIAAFPAPRIFMELMREAQLTDVTVRPFSLDAVQLFAGRPESAALGGV